MSVDEHTMTTPPSYSVTVKREFIAQHFLVGGDWGRENQLNSHRYRVEARYEGTSLDRHGYLLGGSERRKNTAAPRHIATLLRRYRTGSLRAWARRPSLVSVDEPRRDPAGGTRSRSAGTHDPAGQLQAGQRARRHSWLRLPDDIEHVS